MHPQIRRSEPGNCPICGMALEPLEPSLDDGPNPELIDMTGRFWVSALVSGILVPKTRQRRNVSVLGADQTAVATITDLRPRLSGNGEHVQARSSALEQRGMRPTAPGSSGRFLRHD